MHLVLMTDHIFKLRTKILYCIYCLKMDSTQIYKIMGTALSTHVLARTSSVMV